MSSRCKWAEVNHLEPEVAHHHRVRESASIVFDSRRLHHRSLRSLGFGGVVRQTGFGLRPCLNRLDSRRLHHFSGVFRAFQLVVPAASPLAPRHPGSQRSKSLMAASNAAGLRCMYRCVVARSRCPASS